MSDATPYSLHAGSRLLQDRGFLAFTLPHVEILMPTKKPRGQELRWEQQRANQALHQRRLRIEPVNGSVKRCRVVKDRIRLWKDGCHLTHKSATWAKICVKRAKWQRYASNSHQMFLLRSFASSAPFLCS